MFNNNSTYIIILCTKSRARALVTPRRRRPRSVIVGPARGGRIILRRFSRGVNVAGTIDKVRIWSVSAQHVTLPTVFYYHTVVQSLLQLYGPCYVTSPPNDLTVKEFRSHRVVYIADILVGGFRDGSSREAVRRL